VDLSKYQELTGTTVAEGDTARYNAVIRRTSALLESALGYSLSPSKNLDKQELGKVQFEGQYPYYPINVNNLLDPDEQDGEYRLFPYNENDIYIKTDPFSNIYHVKLVQPLNDDEFVTISDLTDYTNKRTRNFGKYIEKQLGWFTWNWYSWLMQNLGQDNGLLIAIDADWLSCTDMPMDLQYLWADMVTYYASDEVSVTGNIKSESVNGHSWSKTNAGGGKGVDLSPDQSPSGLNIIAQYAGPNGTLATRIPTI
jgi:hypothetical protein